MGHLVRGNCGEEKLGVSGTEEAEEASHVGQDGAEEGVQAQGAAKALDERGEVSQAAGQALDGDSEAGRKVADGRQVSDEGLQEGSEGGLDGVELGVDKGDGVGASAADGQGDDDTNVVEDALDDVDGLNELVDLFLGESGSEVDDSTEGTAGGSDDGSRGVLESPGDGGNVAPNGGLKGNHESGLSVGLDGGDGLVCRVGSITLNHLVALGPSVQSCREPY
jgi:hypothetical protein